MTELPRRMIEELQLRNYSPNTITVYIRCVAQFAQRFRLSPDRLGGIGRLMTLAFYLS